MTDIAVTRIDPADTDRLLTWHATMREAYTTDRTAAWFSSPDTMLTQFSSIRPGHTLAALAAHRDGELVGGAEVSVRPGEPAEVELGVAPSHRRCGVGSALAKAARELLTSRDGGNPAAEAVQPDTGHEVATLPDVVQVETYSRAGVAFSRAQGLEVGLEEHRLLLAWNADEHRVTDQHRDTDEHLGARTSQDRVTIRSWIGACPDDIVEAYARLTQQMEEDVPLGEMTRTVRTADVERTRANEVRMAAQGWALVNSLALLDGEPVGYTQIFVSHHDPDIITQDDTLVDRAHRGHGIGRALKLANLAQLATVPEAADARWIQTYTAVGNAPMLALNHALGFRVADTMTALEGPIAAES